MKDYMYMVLGFFKWCFNMIKYYLRFGWRWIVNKWNSITERLVDIFIKCLTPKPKGPKV